MTYNLGSPSAPNAHWAKPKKSSRLFSFRARVAAEKVSCIISYTNGNRSHGPRVSTPRIVNSLINYNCHSPPSERFGKLSREETPLAISSECPLTQICSNSYDGCRESRCHKCCRSLSQQYYVLRHK
jgi:hypothetical protein